MTAPSPQGTPTTRHNAASTTATGDVPSGVLEDELLVAHIISCAPSIARFTGSCTSNNGYTNLGVLSSGNSWEEVWYKRASASEGSTHTWTNASSAVNSVGIFRVADYDMSNSWDDEVFSTSSTSAAASLSLTAITTDVDEELLLTFGCYDANTTWNTTASMTELYDSGSGTRSMQCQYQVITSAGTSGAKVIDPTGTGRIVGIMSAIRPQIGLPYTIGGLRV